MPMTATIARNIGSEPQFRPQDGRTNLVVTTTKSVVESSSYVRIDQYAVQEFTEKFDPRDSKWWLSVAPFDFTVATDEGMMNFLLLLDSLSFRYWSDPKWSIQYEGKSFDGAWAMVASLKRALDNGKPILDASYCAKISLDDVKEIFAGEAKIPLLRERWRIIRQVGTVLLRKCGGQFSRMLEDSKNDALTLLQSITDNMPSFRDISVLDGEKVFFLKKAQLLVADVHRTLRSRRLGELKNMELITACADYKIPWVLRNLGILEYSDQLAFKVDNSIPIERDTREEIEIRANTIWAVEFIKTRVNRSWPHITSMMINEYLWLLGQIHIPGDTPYHHTNTIFY